MIKFFREIRRQLVNKNKTTTYLKYASGEILLVVVGILIALQINSWNEHRKLRIKEFKSLKELRSDLAQNLDDINGNITAFQDCQKSNEIIIYHIEKDLPYSDSLDYHFLNLYPFISFTVNQTTYETLKQNGFDLISNDSLRNLVSDLYSNRFKAYQTFENTYMVNHFIAQIKPMYMTEFTSFDSVGAHPKNYNQFIKNTEYKQIMNFTIDICRNFIAYQSSLGTEVQSIIDIIDKEIDE